MWKWLAVALALAAAPVGAQPSDGGTAAQTPEGGNVATRLVRDVASDYKNFLSIDTAQRITIGAFAAGAVHAADEEIASSIQEGSGTSLSGGATYGSQWLHIPLAVAWWAIVCTAAVALRQHFTGKGIIWLNRIAGAVILVFGVVALISLLPLPWRHWAHVLDL